MGTYMINREVTMPISHWPKPERLREKLYTRGPAALSDAELLAIPLRTGTLEKRRWTWPAISCSSSWVCARCWKPMPAASAVIPPPGHQGLDYGRITVRIRALFKP